MRTHDDVALLLVAHGAPAANGRVRRLAAAIRRRRRFAEVAVGFHHGEPGFADALDETAATTVVVVPLMAAAGHYARHVLPRALAGSRRARAGEVTLVHAPPLGAHPALARLLAARVTAIRAAHALPAAETSVVLVGHGTSRHAASRETARTAADALGALGVAADVRTAFIDDTPDVAAVLGDPVTRAHAIVVPFLFGGGGHATSDVPALALAARGAGDAPRLWFAPALGEEEGIETLVLDLAASALAARHADPRPPVAASTRAPGGGDRSAGIVHLVGAGPGDAGLLTVRGLALIRAADVLVHDRLVDPAILAEGRADALRIDVGKDPGGDRGAQGAIHAALIAHARAGRTVVRVKGGDPFVFGRGAEEVDALRAAGVPVHVVPGVSSALAAPAAAGIPVTARGEARAFAVVSARQHGDGGVAHEELARVAGVDTVVVLMARAPLAHVAATFRAAGRDPATPAACVAHATTPRQRVVTGTLDTIADAVDAAGLTAPLVVVVGAVAARAHADVAAWAGAAAGATAGA